MSRKREQGRRERTRRSEHEGTTKVSLAFHGYLHHPLNLQVLPQIETNLHEQFSAATGPQTLYLEWINLPRESREPFQRAVEDRGMQKTLLHTWLYIDNGELPEPEVVDGVKEELEKTPLALAIRSRLLQGGKDRIGRYYLAGVVDRLRGQHPSLQVVFESHPKEKTDTIIGLSNEMNTISGNAIERWGTTDFTILLGESLSSYEIQRQIGELRRPGLVNDITGKAKGLRKNGGSLALLFGSSHEYMLEDIEKEADPTHSFLHRESRLYTQANDTVAALNALALIGQDLPGELVAKVFFADVCLRKIADLFFQGSGSIADFANNLQTIHDAVQEVASGLSWEDIRRLNDTGEPVLKVFFEHPAARVVLPYLH